MTITNDNNLEATDRLLQDNDWQTKSGIKSAPIVSQDPSSLSTPSQEDEIWACTWSVWLRIAIAATSTAVVIDRHPNPLSTTEGTATRSNLSEDRRREEYQQPRSLQHKQQFLTSLLKIFPLVFMHIKTRY